MRPPGDALALCKEACITPGRRSREPCSQPTKMWAKSRHQGLVERASTPRTSFPSCRSVGMYVTTRTDAVLPRARDESRKTLRGLDTIHLKQRRSDTPGEDAGPHGAVLGRYWGEIASLAVVVRHPLMWHYLRPIRWHNHQFHCRNEGRPFLRPQACGAMVGATCATAYRTSLTMHGRAPGPC